MKSASVSLCLPPICYDASSGSGSVGNRLRSNINPIAPSICASNRSLALAV
ncbi:MAG: hypothetical protein ABI606_15185 [Rhodoferax sp.]